MFDIKTVAKSLLEGSMVPCSNGIKIYTPDGKGNYRALWTRDFAYMVESALELMDSKAVKECIDYILAGAAEDGWIPDRVKPDGQAIYTAGASDFPGLPNLDNGPFAVFAVEAYLNSLSGNEATRQFAIWESALCKGMDCLPVDADGLIENNTCPPHSPYGFTDCVCKTGALSMETLLLWRAEKMLVKRLTNRSKAEEYAELIRRQESVFCDRFIRPDGMLRSATGIGNQIDVWGSCYAVSINFPLSSAQKAKISDWLVSHYDTVVQSGQLRHLPAGEVWEKFLVPVGVGTYQNGAFWATPTGWLYDALRETNPELATQTLRDILKYFETYGIFECVNGENRKLDTYVASAANVYAACRRAGLAE